MKIRIIILTSLLLIILLPACNNDIALFNNNQQKSYVIFGLLNSTDSLQQVKIRMTSVTDAPISDLSNDSTEFSANPNLIVTIQEWQKDYCAIFPMKRTLYSKEPGLFFNTRNDIYQALITPDTDMDYKLMITNPDNGDLITSKIVPVQPPKLGSPTWPWVRYNFSNEADPFNIRFNEVPRAHVYLVQFTIHFIEVYENGDTIQQHSSFVHQPRYVDNPPEYSPVHLNLGSEINQHMSKKFTYNVFDEVIPDRSGLKYRQLICFEIAVWGGDQNLRNYLEFGIKFSDNRKQVFTNIVNGIGFFGACSHVGCTGILPDQDFMDSLPLFPRTSRLKFRTDLYKTGPQTKAISHDDFLSLIPEISNEK